MASDRTRIILVIFFFPLLTVAQTHTKLDSLHHAFSVSTPRQLTRIVPVIEFELESLPFNERLDWANELLEFSEQQNNSLQRVYAYRILARVYRDTIPTQAFLYGQEALNYARTQDSLTLLTALMELAHLQFIKSLYPEAAKNYLAAMEVAKATGALNLYLECSKRLVMVYYQSGNFDEAVKKGQEFVPMFQKFETSFLASKPNLVEKRGVINTYNAIGLSCQSLQRYDSAIKYYDLALKMAKRTDDEVWIGILSGNKALSLLKLGRDEEALNGILTDLRVSKKNAIWGSARNCAISLSDFFLQKKNISQAAKYVDSVVYFNEKAKEKLPSSYWRVRADVEAAQGNYKAAYATQQEFARRSVADIRAQQMDQVARIKSAYDLSQSQSEIELLTQDNKVKASRLAFQWTLFVAGVIVLALALLLTLHFIYNYRRQKKFTELISLQRDQIEQKSMVLESSNNEINAQNEELVQQQEEIAAQRDALEEQYTKLQTAQEIIERQNVAIQSENERLEREVSHRTQEIRRSNQELLEQNKQLEQFAFITAHNLRSPVARILGLGNLLELSNDETETELLNKKIIHSTKELDVIVRDLVKILELRENDALEHEEVDIVPVLTRTRDGLEKEFMESGAQLMTDFKAGSVVFSVAPYVESIIFNLVSNALKYRHPDRKPLIEVNTFIDDTYFVLAVKDNGLGIDLARHRSSMFNLYKRFHYHVEGKGLGLYLIKNQVTALGGRIDVKSEPDRGTTFFIYFRR